MKGMILTAAVVLVTSTAYGASCSGSLTNNCIVVDSEGDFATEGAPNPAVNLSNSVDLGINEIFLFFNSQIGAFTTTGNFDVDAGFKNPTVARVTVSEGAAGEFLALDLAFNGGAGQSILNAGTYFFALVAGSLNSFAVTGNANPEFAGPVGYNVALSAIPIPAALPLFATALVGMGLIARRRRRA